MHRNLCTGPNYLKQLGRLNFTYAERLVKFGLDLAMLWIHEKHETKHNEPKRPNKRKNKWTNNCQIYIRILPYHIYKIILSFNFLPFRGVSGHIKSKQSK